jgi:hypothetical protein
LLGGPGLYCYGQAIAGTVQCSMGSYFTYCCPKGQKASAPYSGATPRCM